MFRLNRLDSMLIKGFIPPFVVSFFIALFVLVMQTLWLYIDDILGKGAGLFVILEFLVYLSFSMIPLALPIGTLLAGVFLFGNLGERYELSSMKSAGISLVRIMRPVIFTGIIIALFSWVCSDYLIPKTNLKFYSRLHDLKTQKPSLSLAEGVFNEDFHGYIIRIGKKSSNGKDISDVLIYDQIINERNGGGNIISAKDGRMYVTPEGKYLVMELNDGQVYQDPGNSRNRNSANAFIRTSFKTMNKVFDLKEFELDRTDEDLFKNNQRMKNSSKLRTEIDSAKREYARILNPVSEFGMDNSKIKFTNDSSLGTKSQVSNVSEKEKLDNRINKFKEQVAQEQNKVNGVDSLDRLWKNRDEDYVVKIIKRAHDKVKSFENKDEAYRATLKSVDQRRAKHEYELSMKYSFALVCLLFIFVGAPLGGIVRKGGYGYPLILCILVFVVYILLNTFCKRLSDGLAMDAKIAAWIPCLVMLPPGILLTWTGMRDRNLIKDLWRIIKNLMT